MFSPDGRKLVFASNRHDRVAGETNIFIADWVEVSSGDLKVTVYDPSRGVVPWARVIIEGEGFKQSYDTNSEGVVAVRLPADVYRVSVEAPGFRPFTQKDVRIGQGAAQILNPVLEIGPPSSFP
jgi:hypothetical protein